MKLMAEVRADLLYDPNDVGPDCVVRCRISNGPRDEDLSFDPQVGDRVRLVDIDDEPLSGRVSDRDGDRVWVRVELGTPLDVTA